MALYDPIQRYGSSWTKLSDGSERKVVARGGCYYFQFRHRQELVPIPNTIAPPQIRNTPRTTPHGPIQPQSGDNQHRLNEGFNLQGGGRESRLAPDRVDANPGPVQSDVPIRTGRPSQSQQDTSTIEAASRSSASVFDFMQIEYKGFLECSRFLDSNPAILLSPDLNSFLDAAVQAKSNQDPMLSLRCIERYVIIKACIGLSPEGRREYLASLCREGPEEPIWNEHILEFNRVSDEVRRRFQEGSSAFYPYQVKAPGPQGRNQNVADVHAYSSASHTNRGASYASDASSFAPHVNYAQNALPLAYSQPTALPTGAPGSSLPPFESFHGMTASGIPIQAQVTMAREIQPAALAGPLSRKSMNYQQDARRSRADSRASNSYEHHHYKHKLPTVGGIENVQYRANKDDQRAADSEVLDPRFVLRKDAADFFVEGRVFCLMSHEPLGLKPGEDPSCHLRDPQVSVGPKGALIYSKIKWMIVTKKRQGYSICVPISSYGKRGVGQKKMGPEMQAHAIAYPSYLDSPPWPLPGEPQFDKRPIAIDVIEEQDLDPASRIHFGKVQSVEWNVKVREIGCVAQISMADFEEYWYKEYQPREKPRVDANRSR